MRTVLNVLTLLALTALVGAYALLSSPELGIDVAVLMGTDGTSTGSGTAEGTETSTETRALASTTAAANAEPPASKAGGDAARTSNQAEAGQPTEQALGEGVDPKDLNALQRNLSAAMSILKDTGKQISGVATMGDRMQKKIDESNELVRKFDAGEITLEQFQELQRTLHEKESD